MSKLRLILGTMEFGSRRLATDEPVFEVLNAFFASGCKEIDTAYMYGGGKSEECIGRYADSSKLVVATKANPAGPQALKREGVLEQMRVSLERLKMPSVDIFYLHWPDHKTTIEETLSACQQLYQEGKFKELGLSNYSSWEVAEIYHTCKNNGWVLPTVYQGMYNAVTRIVEAELFPCLRKYKIRFYAYNPLAGGLLSGRHQFTDKEKDGTGRFFELGFWSKAYQDRFWRESVFEGVAGVRKALDESYGKDVVSLVSASFRWLNHHSHMKSQYSDGVIIGGSRLEHVINNIAVCKEGPLDDRVVDAFDAAWNLDKGNCAVYYR